MSGSQSTNPVHRWYANLPHHTLGDSPSNRHSLPAPARSSPSPSRQASPSGDLDTEASRSNTPRVPPHVQDMRRLEMRRGMEESQYLASKARITDFNPPVDMRLLEYVSTYNNNLMCPICHCPFVDPVALYDCDHCFCRDCLRQTWTDYTPGVLRGNCPTCRSSTKLIGRGSVSKILQNILDELVVKCPKYEDGCTAEVKRGQVTDHVNIYCGFGWVSCPTEDCILPIWRKDSSGGHCLHHGVSCIDCHKQMVVSNLGIHWIRECLDRKIPCDACGSDVFYRELEVHNKATCPGLSIPCLGSSLGCPLVSKRGEMDEHVRICTFATLAPFLEAQKKRVDEQEEKQALLERKLKILEGGFQSIQDIVDGRTNEDLVAAVTSRIPLLDTTTRASDGTTSPSNDFDFPVPPSTRTNATRHPRLTLSTQDHSLAGSPSTPVVTSPQTWNDAAMSPGLARQYEEYQSTAPAATFANDPYASPLHHLLSLHENLREEVTRVANALQELEGRHSMLILNENLRLKEELTYLGGQVGGVARQVGWLTSARLQEQSRASGSSAEKSGDNEMLQAGQSAVSSAATALRGAARMVNVSREGLGFGRRMTDEGRTKL